MSTPKRLYESPCKNCGDADHPGAPDRPPALPEGITIAVTMGQDGQPRIEWRSPQGTGWALYPQRVDLLPPSLEPYLRRLWEALDAIEWGK